MTGRKKDVVLPVLGLEFLFHVISLHCIVLRVAFCLMCTRLTMPCHAHRTYNIYARLMFSPSSAFCRPYFLSLILWMAMKPVVSMGLKLSSVSMLASSSLYSFSV
jgi:hypothetical protein